MEMKHTNFWTTQKNNYECFHHMVGYREIIKEYGYQRRYKENKIKQSLQKHYDYIINNCNVAVDKERLGEIEKELKNFEHHEWNQAQLRLHKKQKVEGEKPSKYFFSAVKQHQHNNTISSFIDETGKVFDKSIEMLKHVRNLYVDLFSSNAINKFHMTKIWNNVDTLHLEEDDYNDMEKEITSCELRDAINDMAHDKTPGLDGLTAEFYSQFWYVIKDDFLELVNYCKKKKRLPDSMNLALVRLIY